MMKQKLGVAFMGLIVTAAIAAGIFFPVAQIYESNDVDVIPPNAPGPVILSDEFPLDPNLIQEEIQEP